MSAPIFPPQGNCCNPCDDSTVVLPEQAEVTIYAMAHPDKPALIRYIGKTKLPLWKRLDSHWYCSSRIKDKKNCWIRKLKSKGLRPVIWPIEICNSQNWPDRERYWIKLFRPLSILNMCDGGDTGPDTTGRVKSPQELEKIASANRGKKRSVESIARMSAAQKRICGTPEARDRNRTIQLKVKNTPEFKARARGWRMRFWHDPTYAEKSMLLRSKIISNANSKTNLARLKMVSDSQRGTTLSEEHKKVLSESHRGHVHSDETKAKIKQTNILNSPTKKRVICITTGESFHSIKQASKCNGASTTGISNACRSGQPVVGLHWKYL